MIRARRGAVKPILAAILVGLCYLYMTQGRNVVVLEELGAGVPSSVPGRWSEEEAWRWQIEHGWVVGGNYAPASAINQLEMWQAETWDPEQINKELGWANQAGMNTMRVFLHDKMYTSEESAFLDRVDKFLDICKRNNIKPIIVLFDACWRGVSSLGTQPTPIPHTHNPGWLQSPDYKLLFNESRWDELRAYVLNTIDRFKKDDRILFWDVYNEPNNVGLDFELIPHKVKESPIPEGANPHTKSKQVFKLLAKTFEWARSVQPVQPITGAIWGSMTPEDNKNTWDAKFTKLLIESSDIITFHNYDSADDIREYASRLLQYKRPIICTEYMARGYGSKLLTVLPVLKEMGIGAVNWGLVDGKSQTSVCV